MKRSFIIFLFPFLFVFFPLCAGQTTFGDTLKKDPDTTNLHVIRTDSWLIQAGYEYRYLSLDFKNMSMNMSDQLYLRSDEVSFGKRITDWNFKPILAQNYAFVAAETKYGRFSYSKDIPTATGTNGQTRLQSYSLDIPYEKLTAGFSYLKMSGFNRKDPLTDSTVFLKDMAYIPFQAYLGYSLGKLKNPLLYQPRKRTGATHINIGYNQVRIANSGDFIPAMRFNGQGNNLENVQEVNNVFANRFVSKGVFLTMDYSIIFPMVKPTTVNKFHCIYLQVRAAASYSFQSYQFDIISDSLNNSQSSNAQYKLFRHHSGVTSSYILCGDLVFDFNKVVISAKANYQQFNYGLANGSSLGVANLYLSNTKLNVFLTFSYRFTAKKINDKVDGLMSKFEK